MTAVTCPNGHQSESTDYCDTCGALILAAPTAPETGGTPEAGASGEAAPSGPPMSVVPDPPAVKDCPNCEEDAAPDALFCENCGYDFTTGTMPRATTPPASPSPSTSAADPDADGVPDAVASAPPPNERHLVAVPPPPAQTTIEWVVERWVDPDWYEAQQADDPCPSPGLPVVVPLTAKSVLIGRPSKSRGISPDIDCGDDTGVSRRQAQLTTDGQRWWVEDLQSSNGTFVGPASGPLPKTPVPPGQRQELEDDDRVYVGAWTRLVVRRATQAESTGQA